MSNSNLVDITMISPNSSLRTAKIDRVTIHHMACKATAEVCAVSFMPTSRRASANYCIGYDGSVALSVPEDRRSWCSSSRENDDRAITIECSNDGGDPDWHVSDATLNKLVELCTDICRRNGIERLNFTGDVGGNVTLHKWFTYTACPGPYLESKIPWVVEEVNRRLDTEGEILYRVQVGAFRVRSNAEGLRDTLREAGYADAFITEGAVAS